MSRPHNTEGLTMEEQLKRMTNLAARRLKLLRAAQRTIDRLSAELRDERIKRRLGLAA